MDVKKRLIFHFYAGKDYRTNRAVLIHLECLKHYHKVFDEALFCVAVDDVNDSELITSVETDICKCGFKDLHFKVVQNDIYREARTFYDEIIAKIDVLDGMTFFGHTKGYTNYKDLPYFATSDKLDSWITGLYYFSLEFASEAELHLFGQPFFNVFYGSFLTYCEKDSYNKSFIYYSGTFFWTNALRLLKNTKEMPLLDDLGYAERFPSCFFTVDDFYNRTMNSLSGYGYYMTFTTNLYYRIDEVIREFLNNEKDYNKFLNYKTKILANI